MAGGGGQRAQDPREPGEGVADLPQLGAGAACSPPSAPASQSPSPLDATAMARVLGIRLTRLRAPAVIPIRRRLLDLAARLSGPCCNHREQWRALARGVGRSAAGGSPAPIEALALAREPLARPWTSTGSSGCLNWWAVAALQRDHGPRIQGDRAPCGVSSRRGLFSPAWPWEVALAWSSWRRRAAW